MLFRSFIPQHQPPGSRDLLGSEFLPFDGTNMRVEDFIARFEAACTRFAVPDNRRAAQLAIKLTGPARGWLETQDATLAYSELLRRMRAKYGARFAEASLYRGTLLLTPAAGASGADRETALQQAFWSLEVMHIPFSPGRYELLCYHYTHMIPPHLLGALHEALAADPTCNDAALHRIPVAYAGHGDDRYIVTSEAREDLWRRRLGDHIQPHLQRVLAGAQPRGEIGRAHV